MNPQSFHEILVQKVEPITDEFEAVGLNVGNAEKLASFLTEKIRMSLSVCGSCIVFYRDGRPIIASPGDVIVYNERSVRILEKEEYARCFRPAA